MQLNLFNMRTFKPLEMEEVTIALVEKYFNLGFLADVS